ISCWTSCSSRSHRRPRESGDPWPQGAVSEHTDGPIFATTTSPWLWIPGRARFARSPGTTSQTLAERHVDCRFRQLRLDAALIALGDQGTLELVALVEEGDAEGKADIAEDLGILRPGDHRARAHHRRQVAVGERVAGQIGEPHHLVDDVAAFLGAIVLRLGE